MFPQKKIEKKRNLVRFDVSLHTILEPPRQFPSHAICGLTQVLRIEYGGPLRSVSSLIMEASLCGFFSYYMGTPQIISMHTILAPPDHFPRLLYGAPQITFFSYNMGAPLRSVSLFTIWASPSDQFLCMLLGGHLRFWFLHKIYGGPLRSVSPLTIWGPLRLVSLLTIWGPSDQFLCILFGGPSQIIFSLTIWGPLRSVSSHTI